MRSRRTNYVSRGNVHSDLATRGLTLRQALAQSTLTPGVLGSALFVLTAAFPGTAIPAAVCAADDVRVLCQGGLPTVWMVFIGYLALVAWARAWLPFVWADLRLTLEHGHDAYAMARAAWAFTSSNPVGFLVLSRRHRRLLAAYGDALKRLRKHGLA